MFFSGTGLLFNFKHNYFSLFVDSQYLGLPDYFLFLVSGWAGGELKTDWGCLIVFLLSVSGGGGFQTDRLPDHFFNSQYLRLSIYVFSQYLGSPDCFYFSVSGVT